MGEVVVADVADDGNGEAGEEEYVATVDDGLIVMGGNW